MTIARLLDRFEEWSQLGESLVLATVYHTEGSTYSKAGSSMLISADGRFQGMLSGGCLEGDLALQAATVLENDAAAAVTYDLRQDEDDIWGLGVGCDGVIHVLLQPLHAASGYEPFSSMQRIWEGDVSGHALTVIDSENPALVSGNAVIAVGEEILFENVGADDLPELMRLCRGPSSGESAQGLAGVSATGCATVLYFPIRPPIRLLVLGAGPDAEPLVRIATELGWRVSIQDHRSAYVEAGDFADCASVSCMTVPEFAEQFTNRCYDAVVVMSHHLETDRQYLAMLSEHAVSYIGLLGPVARRDRLLAALGDAGHQLSGRVHGPAGLDLGGRGAAAIALSITAEIHQVLEA